MALTRPFSGSTPTRAQLLATPGGELYLKSWLAQRLVVGLLGVFMPIILIVGEAVLFGAADFPRSSLSAYYFSGLSVVFVGTLCATGVFLITYMAFHRNGDNYVSTGAGIFAIAVAVFPTWPARGESPAPIQLKLGEGPVQFLHSACAVLFIGLLAVMSWRFAGREGERGNRRLRAVHLGCAAAMVASAVLALIGKLLHVEQVGGWSGLLLVELACTWAFGISWFLKGAELSDAFVRLGLCGNPQHLRHVGDGAQLPVAESHTV
jgi:hypothetical protein